MFKALEAKSYNEQERLVNLLNQSVVLEIFQSTMAYKDIYENESFLFLFLIQIGYLVATENKETPLSKYYQTRKCTAYSKAKYWGEVLAKAFWIMR